MILPSYQSAYVSTLSIETAAGDIESSFEVNFPNNSSSDYARQVGGVLLSGEGFSSVDANDMTVPYRVYQFSRVQDFYYDVPGTGFDAPIYKVVLVSFSGNAVTPDQLDALGYEYVYLSHSNVGSLFESHFTFTFIPRSDLPPGLDYDFSNDFVGEFQSGIMNWLYQFGSDVYTFFPSVSDLLETQILGQSFSWLLIQGFLVYCGYVVVKFIVGIAL